VAAALLLPVPAALGQSEAGFTARPPSGTFRQLADGTLKMRVHCPTNCTVAARLTVPAQDARRMALPFWEEDQLLAVESDNDSFPAGDAMLGFQLVTSAVRRYMVPSFEFPVLGSVRVKVELQADFDDGGSATPSVTGHLLWPATDDENGGRGTPRGIVRSISGPRSVALGTPTASYTVDLRPTSAASTIHAGVHTGGGLLDSASSAFYDGARKVGPKALRRGGTFTLRVGLRHGNLRAANDVAPLAAEVYVDVVDGATGKLRDHGIRRLTLTR